MRYFLFVITLFLLCPGTASAKKKRKRKFTSTDIVSASDSLLRSKIGAELFKYCKYDNSSYYNYGKGRYQYYLEVLPDKKLSKQFNKAHVIYRFTMPYGECKEYDTISGTINVYLVKNDSAFVFDTEPDSSFIPGIAVNHEPCGFISEKEATDIALKDKLVQGVNKPYAVLQYSPEQKKFAWIVLSLLWNERDFTDNQEVKKDAVVIDAESGDIIKHEKIVYTDLLTGIF